LIEQIVGNQHLLNADVLSNPWPNHFEVGIFLCSVNVKLPVGPSIFR
jgi:hypothetical protein